MTARPRPGFSAFDLISVMTILGILGMLLVPAIIRVRHTAARVRSGNNIRQIALACHTYHDATNALPPGNNANHFSAAAHLLPYIEQDDLNKEIDFQKDSADPVNEKARKTTIKLFLSPLDPVQKVTDAGATNYLFNAGSLASLEDNNGVFYLDSQLTLSSIAAADGTSKTVMIGETLKGDPKEKPRTVRRLHVALKAAALNQLKDNSGVDDFKNGKNLAADRGASWLDGRFLQGTFNAGRHLNDPRPDVNCEGVGGLSGLRAYDNFVHVGMCDGTVRAIFTSIKPAVWKALTTRNGGETVGAGDD